MSLNLRAISSEVTYRLFRTSKPEYILFKTELDFGS